MDIITPQMLYHGTTDATVESFERQLLSQAHWRPGRDFGEGFYTTISIAQARKWAHKAAKESWDGRKPCVLAIELSSIPAEVEPLIFLSNSQAWGSFIFEHRKIKTKGSDPCDRHPDFIVGPMADNDTGKIVHIAVQLDKDDRWFYEQITKTRKGRTLDSLLLGNQVVFGSERWEQHLKLIGCYIYTGGRWLFHDSQGGSKTRLI